MSPDDWGDGTICEIAGVYSYQQGTYQNSPREMTFTCGHCETVNGWMADQQSPWKCRACGAPRKS